jgi:hypothetical protein
MDLQFTWAGPYYSGVSINLNIGDWNMGIMSEDTIVLLHELGHAINYLAAGLGSQNSFASDGFSWQSAASAQNTKNVTNDCWNAVAPQ